MFPVNSVNLQYTNTRVTRKVGGWCNRVIVSDTTWLMFIVNHI